VPHRVQNESGGAECQELFQQPREPDAEREAVVVHLLHLGLPVRDQQRSQRFYVAYFGFDPATAQEYEDGTLIIPRLRWVRPPRCIP
jgi:hypothetical protein